MELLNIIIVSIGVLGTVSNGILLLIFMINPLKTFSSTSTYFIKSLTVADFVTSSLSVIWGLDVIRSQSFLRAYYFIVWMSVQVSFYLIFLMSIERYIAVHYPLKKQAIVTKQRTLACIVIAWSFSAIIAGLLEMEKIRFCVRFGVFSLFDVIVVCVAVVYIGIVAELRKISREVRRSSRPNSTSQLRMNKIREDRQLLIVVLVLLTILIITVLPYTLASQILLVDNLFYNEWKLDKDFLKLFVKYYFPVELLNFAVNPIIYAIRLPNYRRSLMALLSCSRGGESQDVTQNP